MLYYDYVAGTYFHMIESGQANIGHLDELLATEDSLFLTDLSGARTLFWSSPNGTIYQLQAIQAVPEPATCAFALGVASGAIFGGRRSRTGRGGVPKTTARP